MTAMSGILKRKFEEVEAAASPCTSLRGSEEDDEVSSSESGDSRDSLNPSASRFSRESKPPLLSLYLLSLALCL